MKPHDHRDKWDAQDIATLRREVKIKKQYRNTWASIGRYLGRTADSVRHKARRLGIKP